MPSAESRESTSAFKAGGTPQIHVGCPKCDRSYIMPVREDGSAGPAPPFFVCERCQFPIKFHRGVPEPHQPVEQCALCGNREFFRQKDFNRKLGLWLVLISGMIALLVMVAFDHRVGIGVLFLVTLIDWFIYWRLKEVTVCYLCHAIYRGFPANASHGSFHLGSEEHFKKRRREWLETIQP